MTKQEEITEGIGDILEDYTEFSYQVKIATDKIIEYLHLRGMFNDATD